MLSLKLPPSTLIPELRAVAPPETTPPYSRFVGSYDGEGAAPGIRLASCWKLRSLIGRFAICACDTGCSICDVEVSTCVAMLEPATCWVSPATSRTRLEVRVPPAARRTVGAAVAKLLFCALTS